MKLSICLLFLVTLPLLAAMRFVDEEPQGLRGLATEDIEAVRDLKKGGLKGVTPKKPESNPGKMKAKGKGMAMKTMKGKKGMKAEKEKAEIPTEKVDG